MDVSYKKIGQYYYNPSNWLGRGGFGTVYLGYDVNNLEARYAIKAMPIKTFIESEKKRELVIREINTLRRIQGEHIVGLVDVMQNVNNLYLVMEYCDGEDLDQRLKKVGTISEKEACSIVKQIADMFVSLERQEILNDSGHKVTIMHRDIKPANILFKNGKVKVADFGFVKVIEDEDKDAVAAQTLLGTQMYMPPQILNEKGYSAKCDVWSTGILLYKAIFGVYPWKGSSDSHLHKNILNTPLQFPDNIPVKEETKDLLRHMLKVEEQDRFSWREVYDHLALRDC